MCPKNHTFQVTFICQVPFLSSNWNVGLLLGCSSGQGPHLGGGGGCSCSAASAQRPLPHPGGLRGRRRAPRECPEPSSAPDPPRLPCFCGAAGTPAAPEALTWAPVPTQTPPRSPPSPRLQAALSPARTGKVPSGKLGRGSWVSRSMAGVGSGRRAPGTLWAPLRPVAPGGQGRWI